MSIVCSTSVDRRKVHAQCTRSTVTQPHARPRRWLRETFVTGLGLLRSMCGILCYTDHDQGQGGPTSNPTVNGPRLDLSGTQALLAHRGPDGQNAVKLACPHQPVVCHFYATLLWLRGRQPVLQPRLDPTRSHVWLWNGDVFGGLPPVPAHENDTQVILARLQASDKGNQIADEHVPDVLGQIQGPFAFVYWRVASGKIWFGRDPLGRHSLLMGRDPRRLFLSSVVDPSEVDAFELPALGIYQLDLAASLGQPASIQIHAWRPDAGATAAHLDARFVLAERTLTSTVSLTSVVSTHTPPGFLPADVDPGSPSVGPHVLAEYLRFYQTTYVEPLESHLSASIRIRAQAQPAQCHRCRQSQPRPSKCVCARVGVLFSGGLDSVLITALLCQVLPIEQSIDLMNVAFQKSDSPGQPGFLVPDRLTGLQALQELQELYPTRRFNFVPVDVTKAELMAMREKRLKKLLYPLTSVLDDSIGCALWFAARGSTTARVLLLVRYGSG
ncbi:asparagine synthetase domain-containing protein 1-like isoform X2 [Tigriopus californicus]|uniref:asparagine synthetase domain-containing protein 1-like isoform X2 n=1 Tax=Tigriopus californicus TaxID=6832 RepID=UPI0027DA0E77|nr:asparagine synthetase domain-containing protein 1-like isoform X2 [Tigriopus californicus]